MAHRFASSYRALDPIATMEMKSNNGDLFVTESSLSLAAADHVEGFDPAVCSAAFLERLNSDFDAIFIRGANTLSDEVYAGILADFLEKVRVKVVCMGIGVQAVSLDRMPKGKDVQRLACLLGSRSATVGVRGEVTASYFERQGVKNIRIVGCPSILRHNDPNLRIRKPAWSSLQSVGFSLTRYYSHVYQRDPQCFLDVQSRLIKELHRRFRLGILSQAEKEERAFAYRDRNAMAQAAETLRGSGWFDPEMEEIYRTRSIFFGTSAAAYDMQVRNFDAVFGTRLHANAMALACGIPAITLTFDLRVQEIYDFWRLPSFPIEEVRSLAAKNIYRRASFEAFNMRMGFLYGNFREYLEENGIPHRMKREPHPDANAAGLPPR